MNGVAKSMQALYVQRLIVVLLSLSVVDKSAASPRIDTLLFTNWKFIRQDVPRAPAPDLDDTSWQSITLPHTWNNKDGQDGGDDYYRGPAWYRLHLKLDDTYKNKRLYLRLEGSSIITDVYVNGRHSGAHRGSFGAFCFDITDKIRLDQDNLIAVRVTNASNKDVPPLSSDFTVFGGIYRPVHLIALNQVSISPVDDASPGIYIKQKSITTQRAQIEIKTRLQSALSEPTTATLDIAVIDGKRAIAATQLIEAQLDPNSTRDVVTTLSIDNPHLWNARLDPHLYQVSINITHNGTVTDSLTQPLGLRSFKIDPQLGLILNGKPYHLHGVNRHQDRLDKGWALTSADHKEDLDLILEMGCTGVRLAHYQHADEFYALCDRAGLIVIAEIPLVNEITSSQAFFTNTKTQLRELIKQNYNHPSICFWSLFNELVRQIPPDQVKLVEQLNSLAHELDDTRPTTAGSHLAPMHILNSIPDIICFNRYFGWYEGTLASWPTGLDKLRSADRLVAISEYGAGASILQHEPDPAPPVNSANPWHPEEFQSLFHESAWYAMTKRPWIWGTFVWNMCDFAVDKRAEGDTAGRNDKGLVTYDRKTKKDAFYFYKANWSDDPFAYITSRRFTPRPIGATQVKVYSNCDSVELFLNGDSIGSKTASNHIFLWDGVRLSEGNNALRAVGAKSGHRYEDTCAWRGSQSASPRLGPTQTTKP